MTRQELETFASENPQELALLFAQKVAGWKEAELVYNNPLYPILMTRNTPDGRILEYPNNWTAVINAGKKAGIEWEKFYRGDRKEIFMTSQHESGGEGRTCNQQPNWPDCAALMIVMIEVMETKL